MIKPIFFTKNESATANYGKFIIEPLIPSFGQSLGNSLRRTLLSSLKGAAITSVKFSGASHMFTTIKGIKESVLEIILNLKQLRFELPNDGKYKITLSKKGTGKIYAKNIEGEIKVANGDVYIAEITDDKGKLEIEMSIETGIGYISAEEQQNVEFGFIPIDSSFSPVKKVDFKVEEARVGRKTNFDRLILEIWTDGTINPEKVLKNSAQILATHFERILSGEDTKSTKEEIENQENKKKEEINKKFSDLIIDELNLPSRVVNALLRENIETVADLMKIGKDKLVGLKGLGKKSIELIEEELKKLGIQLEV